MRINKQRANIGYQFMALKNSNLVTEGEGIVTTNYFYWECNIQPTPLSRVYRVLIFYGADFVPRAFVLDPNLKELVNGRNIPHLYNQDRGYLCLYYPSVNEWNPSMSIVNDFVPWIYMWLTFFEQWIVTDEWEGGGIHPSVPSRNITAQTSSSSRKKTKKRKVSMPYRDHAYKLYDKRVKRYMKESI